MVEEPPGFRGRGAFLERKARKNNKGKKKLAGAGSSGSLPELRAIYHANPDGLLVAEAKSQRILKANPRACRMFGYTPRQFLAKSVHDLHPPMSMPQVRGFFRALLLGKTTLVANVPCRKKNGDVFFVDITGRTCTLEGKRCLVGFFRDVTRRRLVEEELKVTKERLEYILGATKTGIDVIDEDFNLQYVDPVWQKKYGNPKGHKCYQYFMDRDRVCSSCGIPAAFKRGKVTVTQETLPREGNRIIEVHTIPFQDHDGKKMVAEFNLDITERKRNDDVLRESEEKFRTVAERSPNMIFINQAGKVVYANRKCEQMMGYRLEEFYAPSFDFMCLIHPEDIPAVKSNFMAHQKGREVPPYEYKLLTRKGKVLHAILTTQLITFRGQKAILGIITDITERKNSEAALRLANFSLDHAEGSIFWIDRSARFFHVNEAACRMLGYSRRDLLAKKVPDIDPKFSMTSWPRHWEELRKKKTMTFESVHKTQGGKNIPVEVSLNYLEFEGQSYNFAFVRDISKRKQAEEALRENEARIRALSGNLANGMVYQNSESPERSIPPFYFCQPCRGTHAWADG